MSIVKKNPIKISVIEIPIFRDLIENISLYEVQEYMSIFNNQTQMLKILPRDYNTSLYMKCLNYIAVAISWKYYTKYKDTLNPATMLNYISYSDRIVISPTFYKSYGDNDITSIISSMYSLWAYEDTILGSLMSEIMQGFNVYDADIIDVKQEKLIFTNLYTLVIDEIEYINIPLEAIQNLLTLYPGNIEIYAYRESDIMKHPKSVYYSRQHINKTLTEFFSDKFLDPTETACFQVLTDLDPKYYNLVMKELQNTTTMYTNEPGHFIIAYFINIFCEFNRKIFLEANCTSCPSPAVYRGNVWFCKDCAKNCICNSVDFLTWVSKNVNYMLKQIGFVRPKNNLDSIIANTLQSIDSDFNKSRIKVRYSQENYANIYKLCLNTPWKLFLRSQMADVRLISLIAEML